MENERMVKVIDRPKFDENKFILLMVCYNYQNNLNWVGKMPIATANYLNFYLYR